MSPFTVVISTFLPAQTVSCNVKTRETRSRSLRVCRRIRLSSSTFPRVTEAYVRSADEGWHWNYESHRLLRKFSKQNQVRIVCSRESEKKRESANDENEMNDAGISREEDYVFFSFYTSLVSYTQFPSLRSKRLTPMPVMFRSNYSPRIKLKEL